MFITLFTLSSAGFTASASIPREQVSIKLMAIELLNDKPPLYAKQGTASVMMFRGCEAKWSRFESGRKLGFCLFIAQQVWQESGLLVRQSPATDLLHINYKTEVLDLLLIV